MLLTQNGTEDDGHLIFYQESLREKGNFLNSHNYFWVFKYPHGFCGGNDFQDLNALKVIDRFK
jgi:hypothetical protein